MNTNKNSSDKPVKTREKSALYPSVTIDTCLEFIKQIDSLGGKSVSYASICDLLGLTSQTTRSFLGKISSSKQFGLINTSNQTAQLTDLAKNILYPSGGKDETERLLIEVFGNPPLYARLIDRFEEKAVPPVGQLANILLNEYKIIRQVKDSAAECFVRSADYVGVLKNGVLFYDTSEISSKSNIKIIDDDTTTNSDPIDNNSLVANQQSISNKGYNFEIPTLTGKSARVHIPDGVSEKDLDYIALYIGNMLPVFIENLKGEIQTE